MKLFQSPYFGRKERVEAGLEGRMSLKYFKERPCSALFCFAFSVIVVIGLGTATAAIFAINETQDKPVYNNDGETDFKIKAE